MTGFRRDAAVACTSASSLLTATAMDAAVFAFSLEKLEGGGGCGDGGETAWYTSEMRDDEMERWEEAVLGTQDALLHGVTRLRLLRQGVLVRER